MRDFMTRQSIRPLFLRHARIFTSVLLLAAGQALAEDGMHPLADLERAALAHARAQTAEVQGRVEIEPIGLDPRTRLPACGRTSAATAPGTRLWGRTYVVVRCDEPGGWSVNVPLVVSVHAPVLVTVRAMGRGERIDAPDVSTREYDLTRLPIGVLTRPEQAVGRTTVAALPAGATLRPDMLRGALLVRQGQQVSLIYAGEGFRVASEGRALNNAVENAVVRVKTESGRVVSGIATEPGVVEVR